MFNMIVDAQFSDMVTWHTCRGVKNFEDTSSYPHKEKQD